MLEKIRQNKVTRLLVSNFSEYLDKNDKSFSERFFMTLIYLVFFTTILSLTFKFMFSEFKPVLSNSNALEITAGLLILLISAFFSGSLWRFVSSVYSVWILPFFKRTHTKLFPVNTILEKTVIPFSEGFSFEFTQNTEILNVFFSDNKIILTCIKPIYSDERKPVRRYFRIYKFGEFLPLNKSQIIHIGTFSFSGNDYCLFEQVSGSVLDIAKKEELTLNPHTKGV